MEETKSRPQLIEMYLQEIKQRELWIKCNVEKLEIYEGALLPYVLKVMEATLSKNYFDKIKDRVIPVNVLTRIIDKLSKVYITPPSRQPKEKNDSDTAIMSEISEEMGLDVVMGLADEYSHLFKCYAIEPFLDEGKAQARVLPADRFIVMGRDPKNPMKMTDFVKFMGEIVVDEKGNKANLYYAYTKDEFIPFTSDGKEHLPALKDNEGKNPIGKIPFIYGNRSRQSLIPVEDTDITQMTKMIPILLSDLAGAIMFQCFTIIYGIDVDAKNITMSPNAFWSLKSDAKSDQKPTLGTIKPEADVDKVLNFIKQVLAFWLETKGVRVGSLNNMDAGNAASGIAKIIDEMDVFEVKKKQIVCFMKEEKELWDLLKEMNKYWFEIDTEYKRKQFSDNFQAAIKFEEPKPEVARGVKVDDAIKEINAQLLDRATAIRDLNPGFSDEEMKKRFLAVGLNDDGSEPEPQVPELDAQGNPINPDAPTDQVGQPTNQVDKNKNPFDKKKAAPPFFKKD